MLVDPVGYLFRGWCVGFFLEKTYPLLAGLLQRQRCVEPEITRAENATRMFNRKKIRIWLYFQSGSYYKIIWFAPKISKKDVFFGNP